MGGALVWKTPRAATQLCGSEETGDINPGLSPPALPFPSLVRFLPGLLRHAKASSPSPVPDLLWGWGRKEGRGVWAARRTKAHPTAHPGAPHTSRGAQE